MAHQLTLNQLAATVKARTLLKPTSLTLNTGELVVLLGPNGAGKTSLLRTILGLQPATSGTAQLDNQDVNALSAAQRARRVGYLPQNRPLAWPSRVRDVVALGRFAHGAALGKLGTEDKHAVDSAIESCDLKDLANRSADTLSGGELARMHCARVFATASPMLLADEPTAALDPLHQHQVMQLFRDHVNAGAGALVVLHDIALAAKYADRLLWMKNGAIVADGTPAETITADRLASIYGVDAQVEQHGNGMRIHITGAAAEQSLFS